jgi:hypothetical protein
VNGSGEKDKAEKDLEEKPSSLILTTSSPRSSATPIPSLTVSDTILGTFFLAFPLSSQAQLNFQGTVLTAQSSTKVHSNVEPSPSNVSSKIS